MIFNAIVDAMYGLFNTFLDKFPLADPGVAPVIKDSIYNVKAYLAPFNWVVPVDALFLCINYFLGIIIAFVLFKLVLWIASIVSVNLIH